MKRPQTRGRDPISLVLGPTGSGPFALLGLPAADVDVPTVLAALHKRLDQVRASPFAATPAAEDTRLALHAAAAQLCDPAVRRLLLGTWSAGGMEAEPAAEWNDDTATLIERDLHIAVGLSGGWNAAAMARLALACESRGVAVQELGEVLGALMSRPRAEVVSGRGGALGRADAAGVPRRPAHADRTTARFVLLVCGIGAGVVGLVVMMLAMLFAPGRGPTSGEDVVRMLEGGNAAAPLSMEPAVAASNGTASADLAIGDARSIDRELTLLAQSLGGDEHAASEVAVEARFRAAFDAFSTNWHLLRKDEITAVVSSLIDLSFAASQKQREREVIGAIVGVLKLPPTDRRSVRSVVAAGAVASRLLEERDLPRNAREQLEAALRGNAMTRNLGPARRFESAAEQIVLPLAELLAAGTAGADAGAWRGFLDVRDAALGDRTRVKDAASLAALRGVFRASVTESADEVIALLAGSMSWERTPELREAVRDWFEDASVPTPRLATLTRAMVKSTLRGVDSTMTISATASREERLKLGAALDDVLRADDASVGAESARAWVAAADQLLAAGAASPAEALDLAARMAELTAIRQFQMDGRGDAWSGRIDAALAPGMLPPAVPAQEDPSASPASKALEYAAIGFSQASRVEFWKKRLADGGGPDLLLARTAIEEASRGSPAAVREAARDYVRARSGDRAMLVAAIDLVFAIPESRENLDWLSDVAGRRIPWTGRSLSREEAHRALLEAASDRFPTVARADAIDVAAVRLGKAWLLRVGEVSDVDSVDAGEAIRRIATAMLSAGTRGAESDVRRRLEARLSIASGGIQAAVWWQASVVELTSVDLAKRAPRAELRPILDRWTTNRRRANNAFEQLLAGERAVLEMLRAELAGVGKEGT